MWEAQFFYGEICASKQKMHKSQAVFVGDRMYTDILCGVKAGVDTIAVLTGEVQERICRSTNTSPSMCILL